MRPVTEQQLLDDQARLNRLPEPHIVRDHQVRSPHLLDKMVLARHTGLRRSNLFRAQWTWVDWLHWVVRVPRTKNNLAHALPLNDTAHATLQRLYGERDAELDSPYIFVHARDARHAGKPVLDVKNAFTVLEEAASRTSPGTIFDMTTPPGSSWRASACARLRSCWGTRDCEW